MLGDRKIMIGARWIFRTAMGCVLWVLIVPAVAMIPRRKDWIAVIGSGGGNFSDNAKYFFIQAAKELPGSVRCAFVSEHRSITKEIKKYERDALLYPSLRSIWFLIRSGSVVVDSTQWALRCRGYLLTGARLVQIWHGVGFKVIEEDMRKNPVSSRRFLSPRFLIAARRFGLMARGIIRNKYDLVCTTSKFYRDNVFLSALPSKYYIISGYPRNCRAIGSDLNSDIISSTVDRGLLKILPRWRADGVKVVLVTPTFRYEKSKPIDLDLDTQHILDGWCGENEVKFIFKFHPNEAMKPGFVTENIYVCDSLSDIYPIMRLSDAMVTDYSSIFMDYILEDKPVIFFGADIDDYQKDNRRIQFDYGKMTPGPKVRNWMGALECLKQQWRNDDYSCQREAIRLKAFDNLPQCESTKKIINFMTIKNWI